MDFINKLDTFINEKAKVLEDMLNEKAKMLEDSVSGALNNLESQMAPTINSMGEQLTPVMDKFEHQEAPNFNNPVSQDPYNIESTEDTNNSQIRKVEGYQGETVKMEVKPAIDIYPVSELEKTFGNQHKTKNGVSLKKNK